MEDISWEETSTISVMVLEQVSRPHSTGDTSPAAAWHWQNFLEEFDYLVCESMTFHVGRNILRLKDFTTKQT